MDYAQLLNYEFERSNSTVRVVGVPKDKKPTVESLKRLENEIAAQVSSNDAMRSRSMHKI